MSPGENNAITDVPGVRVGYSTLIEGADVRTGVTVILPPGDADAVFAGVHRLNGNGEMTGWQFIREMGMLVTPIAITNTHSVGTLHEALARHAAADGSLFEGFVRWSLPVVAETWDGFLNDINGFHVRGEHVEAALVDARTGPIAEGNVGGGTGMICHGFKGGTGTASRVIPETQGGWTVGVLVQANHGRRPRLSVDGVPVGREIGSDVIPVPGTVEGAGSIIVVVATDAPLLPLQCTRLAHRTAIGIGRTGGLGEDSSGDMAIAFATGNRLQAPNDPAGGRIAQIEMVWNADINPLFEAVVEATEEAIVNAILSAETMVGVDSHVARALDPAHLLEVMSRFGRRPLETPV